MAALPRLSLALAFLVVIAPESRAIQSVRVVQPTSSDALQLAIDAAGEGDLLLVHAGSYGHVRVTGKSLTLLAEPTGGVSVESLTVEQLSAAQHGNVLGLTTRGWTSVERTAVHLLQNVGPVRLQDVHTLGTAPAAAHGALVDGCADVFLARCTLAGTTQQPPLVLTPDPAGPGLRCRTSQLALHGCTLDGAPGRNTVFAVNVVFGGGHGAAGVLVEDPVSALIASGCAIAGGGGGAGISQLCPFVPSPTPGFDGGAGLVANAISLVRESSAQGGAGGQGGSCTTCPPLPPPPPGCGAPSGVAGADLVGGPVLAATPAVALEIDTHVRDGSVLPVTVRGAPGSQVTVVVAARTAWIATPSLEGAVHVAGRSGRLALGTIPAGGVLASAWPVALLAPGQSFRVLHLQAFAQAPSGLLSAGSPAVLVVLDPSL